MSKYQYTPGRISQHQVPKELAETLVIWFYIEHQEQRWMLMLHILDVLEL